MGVADDISVRVNYGLIVFSAVFVILVTEYTLNRSRHLHKFSLNQVQLRYKTFVEDHTKLKICSKDSKSMKQVRTLQSQL